MAGAAARAAEAIQNAASALLISGGPTDPLALSDAEVEALVQGAIDDERREDLQAMRRALEGMEPTLAALRGEDWADAETYLAEAIGALRSRLPRPGEPAWPEPITQHVMRGGPHEGFEFGGLQGDSIRFADHPGGAYHRTERAESRGCLVWEWRLEAER